MKHNLLPNQSIRVHAKQSGVRIYELGDVLGVSQATITRALRYELPEQEQQRFIAAIDTVAASRTAPEHAV